MYTSVLEDFKTSLGNALGLSRTALASMMPRLRSQQSLLQHQEEEVRDGNDLLSASDGNMVTIGAIIEMQAKDNTWHKVVVTKINRTALLGVCLIEGLPISEEAKAAEYYTVLSYAPSDGFNHKIIDGNWESMHCASWIHS